VVGGQGQDELYGDETPWGYGIGGNDIVFGNLGADTCSGGPGDDVVRGGQGEDLLYGDEGDDYLSGDRGADTLSGGAGADRFHTFGEAGIDRVLDFDSAEGDRVMVDPGAHYTVSQEGADVVIHVDGDAVMTLTGVTLAALPSGWIFESW
jgi:Ca2+-binding RTX toxin-like protein